MRHKTVTTLLLCAALALLAGGLPTVSQTAPPGPRAVAAQSGAPQEQAAASAQAHHVYLPFVPRERPGAVLLRAWGNEAGVFDEPRGLEVRGERVYVVDSANDRIQVFDLQGRPRVMFGEWGTAEGQFRYPRDVTVDGQGIIYVADPTNERIQAFTPEGAFLRQWGSDGREPGQFSDLAGIAADEDGTLYAVDSYNARIQVFTSEGAFLRQWGSEGAGEGQFDGPRGIAVDRAQYGDVYVADHENDRIQVFTSEGAFLRQWPSPTPEDVAVDGGGGVYVTDGRDNVVRAYSSQGVYQYLWRNEDCTGKPFSPLGIGVDGRTAVYVVDRWNERVQAFDFGGTLLHQWGSSESGAGQLEAPSGIALDEATGTVYVTDIENHRVEAFTGEGTLLRQWGAWGDEPGQFAYPAGIAVDQTAPGTVYVGDGCRSPYCFWWGHRVQAFTPEGAFLHRWGKGEGGVYFEFPHGLAVGASGTLYVADTYRHRVQVFAPGGVFERGWGSEGSGPGQFDEPCGIAVGRAQPGTVYVADRNNHRIQAFSAEGALQREWGSEGSEAGQLSRPCGLVVDRAQPGTVYVADTDNHRVQGFSPDGALVRQWGSEGREPGQLRFPSGISMDADGAFYVTDTGNARVQVYAPEHPAPDPVHGLALNGSFEETPEFKRWGYGGDLAVAWVDTAAHGSRAVRLGEPVAAEPQGAGSAWLRQTIYVRPEWARPTLTFQYRVYANDTLDQSDFVVSLIRVDGIWLADVLRDGYDPGAPPPAHDLGWRSAEVDLSAYKGQLVRLVFENRNLSEWSFGIWTLVDDVRLVDAGP